MKNHGSGAYKGEKVYIISTRDKYTKTGPWYGRVWLESKAGQYHSVSFVCKTEEEANDCEARNIKVMMSLLT